jgi:hypothetical protein
MREIIDYKRGFKNFIISLIFGIIVPYVLFGVLFPNELFALESIIGNGIIFLIVYTSFGIFKKKSFIRLVIGMSYIFVLIYFYTVGHNVFTMYLPHCAFGTLCVDAELFGINIAFELDYSVLIVIIIILKVLNLIRNYLKSPKEEDFEVYCFK